VIRERLARIGCVTAAGMLLVGCAGNDADWQEAESSSGTYVAEFPTEPEYQTEAIPELGAEQEHTISEVDDGAYTINEIPLEPGMEFDLDGSMEGGIRAALQSLEQEAGEQGHYTEVSRETGDFEGTETREAVADLEVGDESARLRARIFVRDDRLVQALYIGSPTEDEESDRFFDSFELN